MLFRSLSRFETLYGNGLANKSTVNEGIHIENGFNDLLTDQARRILVKIKSNSSTAPDDFVYTNQTYISYNS